MEGSASNVLEGSGKTGSILEDEDVITVRPALLSDYQAVVEINREIFDGLDYVPSIYYTFFHLPQFSAFVVEVNKLVVAFVVFEISEDGSHATAMANRVRPSHQGRGLSSEKNDDIIRGLTSRHPRVASQLYTTRVHPHSMAKVNKSEILYEWKFMCFKVPGERADILRLGSPDHVTGINARELSYIESLRLLDSGDLELFLSAFSKRYILFGSNWRPVPLDKSGLKLLLLNCTVLISEENSTETTSASHNNESSELCDVDKHKIEAFSCSSLTKCRDMSYSDVFFFGTDETLLIRHALMHVKHGLYASESNYSLVLHFPKAINFQRVEEAIREVLKVPRYDIASFSSCDAVLGVKPL